MDTAPGTMVLLTRLSRVVYRRATEEALGVRMKQYVALSVLRDQGALSQQLLGELLMLDPNNLVLYLNELEPMGFVERRRDPKDRRRHIVEITPAGRKALKRAEHALEAVEDEVLGALGTDERATLRGLLAKALHGDGGRPLDAPAATAQA